MFPISGQKPRYHRKINRSAYQLRALRQLLWVNDRALIYWAWRRTVVSRCRCWSWTNSCGYSLSIRSYPMFLISFVEILPVLTFEFNIAVEAWRVFPLHLIRVAELGRADFDLCEVSRIISWPIYDKFSWPKQSRVEESSCLQYIFWFSWDNQGIPLNLLALWPNLECCVEVAELFTVFVTHRIQS